MNTIYRGISQRITRHFFSDNVLVDPSALLITIKAEADGEVLVANSVEYDELDILANKISTGIYYATIQPDADEKTGIYFVYWRPTYDSETWVEGPFVLEIRGEDEIPATVNNYVSLDEIGAVDRRILELSSPLDILRDGERASRILDSELDNRFDVPIRKRADIDKYDQVIIQAASLLTASRILRNVGYTDRSDEIYEEYGILRDGINQGKYRLWEEITEDEIGFSSPVSTISDDSSGIEIEINPLSLFSGEYRKLFVVEVQTGGDIGTATWRFSDDGGATWEESDIETSSVWHSPTNGEDIQVRFFRPGSSGTLTTGDKWEIEARPSTDQITPSSRSPRVQRIEL